MMSGSDKSSMSGIDKVEGPPGLDSEPWPPLQATGTKKKRPWRTVRVRECEEGMEEGAGEKEVREICNVEKGERKRLEMGFQVCDVRKALAAVWRICEAGNIVQFGPEGDDCFISKKGTDEKVFMRREGRSYVVDLVFEGGRPGKLTVDSAAEESACPWEWGEEFGCKEVAEKDKMSLVNASGGKIEHWGSREVRFEAGF